VKSPVLVDVLPPRDTPVGLLTLNRPAQRNPLDHGTIQALLVGLDELEQDPRINSVIVTGTGPAFSAGGDLKAYRELYRQREQFHAFLEDFAALNDRLERGRLVSIAMVNGTCLAGGLELLLSCDLALMADDARIGDGHLAFGQLPGAGGSQRLVRAVGARTARRLLLTGQLVTASEAVAMGLVAEMQPAATLRTRTMEIAHQIARFSSLAISHAKTLLDLAATLPLAEGLVAERALVQDYATESYDASEGLAAFADHRSPRFRGR
jgi:enoyl-CoA hydratase/carnithine racemase